MKRRGFIAKVLGASIFGRFFKPKQAVAVPFDLYEIRFESTPVTIGIRSIPIPARAGRLSMRWTVDKSPDRQVFRWVDGEMPLAAPDTFADVVKRESADPTDRESVSLGSASLPVGTNFVDGRLVKPE